MFDKAAYQIQSASTIVLVSHIQPDGDAVGSLTALAYALDQIGKQVVITAPDQLPDIFSFTYSNELTITDKFPSINSYDLCIVMDVGDFKRTGYSEEIKSAAKLGKLLNIDHHPYGDIAKATDNIIHDHEASSTAELVYELIVQLGVKIHPTLATSILLGIYTDTGGFQYSNTTSRTLDIASELMSRGARLQTITTRLSHTKTLAHLKALGIVLERLQNKTQPIPFSYSIITREDIARLKAKSEDLHGIINDINTLPSSAFSLLLSEEEPGSLKGTLRTGIDSNHNVRGLAKLLGGGGHPKAAGFTVKGSIRPVNGQWKIVKPDKT